MVSLSTGGVVITFLTLQYTPRKDNSVYYFICLPSFSNGLKVVSSVSLLKGEHHIETEPVCCSNAVKSIDPK